MANNNKLIEVRNIKKNFGKVEVLKGISFDILDKENIAIVGGNGCGKTTLIEIIVGLNKPTAGNISYVFDPKNYNNKIGIQFQDSSYPSGLKVNEVIYFMLSLYKSSLSTSELRNLIKTFGIENFYFKTAKSLSGGQLQRLNLLLSLIHKPKIIFLDEISTGLDVILKQKIHAFLIDFCKENNSTLFIISHDYDEIAKLAHRVIVLRDGKIVLNELTQSIVKKGLLSNYLEKFIF